MLSLICLLVMSSTASALQLARISEEPSTGSPTMPRSECEQLLTELETICIETVTQLESEYDERLKSVGEEHEAILRQATEQAAAEAVKPLLVELAGSRAEVQALRLSRLRTGVIAGAIGLVVGALLGGILTAQLAQS
jgi:hypothetical protein